MGRSPLFLSLSRWDGTDWARKGGRVTPWMVDEGRAGLGNGEVCASFQAPDARNTGRKVDQLAMKINTERRANMSQQRCVFIRALQKVVPPPSRSFSVRPRHAIGPFKRRSILTVSSIRTIDHCVRNFQR